MPAKRHAERRPPSTLPLHSREAEEALLGSLLIDPDAIIHINDRLEPADFYSKQNQDVFNAIHSLYARAAPHSDPLVVDAELERLPYRPEGGWLPYLFQLVQSVPTSIHAADYSEIVIEKALRRRLFRAGEGVATLAQDEEGDIDGQLAEAESLILDVRGQRNLGELIQPAHYTNRYAAWFEEKRLHPDELGGLPTGFAELDQLLDGLQSPHQYVLAGRPSMGKSALALNIAAHLALNRNRRVLLFSLEMSAHQIVNRVLSWLTNINSRLKPWRYTLHQLQQIQEATEALASTQLELVTTEGITPSQIRAQALRSYALQGVDLIIVDHLHLMKPDRAMERPDLEINENAKGLANLAKHLNVPVLTLAQLNRSVESRQNKRPTLSDLRESGGIEENAFCVMLLYRDGYYKSLSDRPNVAELIVAKHREGPTGSVELNWEPTTTRFSDRPNQKKLL